MLEWTLAHPWLTVFLVVCGYLCIYYSVKQITWAIRCWAVYHGSRNRTINENVLEGEREDE